MNIDEMLNLIGKNVKFLRQRNDLTQKELAEKINSSLNPISQIEFGSFNCRLTLLESIAKFYNIDLADIFCINLQSAYIMRKTEAFNPDSRELFAQNVAFHLKNRNWSQLDLCSKNVESTTLSLILNIKGNPKIKAYIAIAEGLEIPLKELFK